MNSENRQKVLNYISNYDTSPLIFVEYYKSQKPQLDSDI